LFRDDWPVPNSIQSRTGVDDLIDKIVCGDDVDKGKPHPGLVRLAVEKLSVPANAAVMIGDTPYDAEAARGAGGISRGRAERRFRMRGAAGGRVL
jgi:HAD superfamily hydrolase (TIGR01509 family)